MISKVLRGDYGLLKTFWLGLAINLVVRIVGTKIQDTLIYSQIQNGFILDLLTFSLIYVVFLLVWLVGVWKSGNRFNCGTI